MIKSDSSLSTLKQFPPLIWILLFGSVITRGSFFMVWPFLTVIMYKKFALSATEIGSILSFAAVLSVFISFIGSTLSDTFGRKPLILATGLLYVVSFSLLANASSVAAFTVVITLCSIATSLWSPLASAMAGDLLTDTKSRELALQLLYFSVNVGCALGPLVGVWLSLTGEQSSFYITAGAFSILLLMLLTGFKHQQATENHGIASNQSTATQNQSQAQVKTANSGMANTINILLKDKLLQCLILANVICLFVYAQMDSTLIQYLTREQVPNLLTLISSMLLTNALVIIFSQFILLKIMASRPLLTRIRLGLAMLMLSQLWFAFNPLGFFMGWIGAVVILSLGEAILFPTMSVHIDRIAPQKLRGAYFGASSLYSFGFALAPIGGGYMLDNFGGPWLFILCAILTVAVFVLYQLIDRLSRPRFVNQQPEQTEDKPVMV